VDTTNPKKLRRYHIERGVSISGLYSKLTDKPFSTKQLKIRVLRGARHLALKRWQRSAGLSCGISVIFCAKSQRQVVITQPILQTIPREQFSFLPNPTGVGNRGNSL
jgi:hypothetical protein